MWDSTGPLVVVGTGAFAAALTAAFADSARPRAEVVLLGRRGGAGPGLADDLTNRRVKVAFRPHDTITTRALATTFDEVQPCAVVVCASEQSPYNQVHYSTTWERVRAAAEFGFTAPLQATFAIRAARALRSLSLEHVPLVNACYPDFVNPLMRLLGLQVLCGLGNVASLTTALQDVLGTTRTAPLRMAAHHRHLKGASGPGSEARVWVGDDELPSAAEALDRVRRLPRRTLNDLGARHGGVLLARLLEGETVQTNLPGVSGPGGFPVLIGQSGCEPDLPAGVRLPDLYAWQQHHALAEGVAVLPQGEITFTGASARGLRTLGIAEQTTMHVTRWDQLRARMIEVRAGQAAQGEPVGGPRC